MEDEVKALLPADWQFSLQLDVDDVWNGFFLHALILDHLETGSAGLKLTHNVESQAKRLQPALQERNARMAGPGQEAWNHACDRCCYVFQDPSNSQSCESLLLVDSSISRLHRSSAFYGDGWCHSWAPMLFRTRLQGVAVISEASLLPTTYISQRYLCRREVRCES